MLKSLQINKSNFQIWKRQSIQSKVKEAEREREAKQEAKQRVEREDMIGLSQRRKIVSFGPVLWFPALWSSLPYD